MAAEEETSVYRAMEMTYKQYDRDKASSMAQLFEIIIHAHPDLKYLTEPSIDPRTGVPSYRLFVLCYKEH
jgi:hypothetical protein